MHCREALQNIREHERELAQFLQTPEGIQAESHVSNCRCETCCTTLGLIRSAGVRQGLRLVPEEDTET